MAAAAGRTHCQKEPTNGRLQMCRTQVNSSSIPSLHCKLGIEGMANSLRETRLEAALEQSESQHPCKEGLEESEIKERMAYSGSSQQKFRLA
jgi:hypothetical protein